MFIRVLEWLFLKIYHLLEVEIEERLIAELGMPVIDANQGGNAVATVAGLINIAKKNNINLKNCKVGFIGFNKSTRYT